MEHFQELRGKIEWKLNLLTFFSAWNSSYQAAFNKLSNSIPTPTESRGRYLKEQTRDSQPLTRHLQILIPIVWKQYWLCYGYEHMLEKRGLGCFFPLSIFSWLFSCGSCFWWKGWGYYLRQNQTVIHQTSQCVGQGARCVAWLFGQHLFLAPFNVGSFCACSKVCRGIKIRGEKGYFFCWNTVSWDGLIAGIIATFAQAHANTQRRG